MNIFEWLSLGSAAFVVFGFLAANLRTVIHFVREMKRTRDLEAFDKVISGEDSQSRVGRALLEGTAVVEEEVSIFLPGLTSDDLLVQEFIVAIDDSLQQNELGQVIRAITFDQTSACIDVYLSDFVAGLDVVRRVLPQFDLPANTTIEYTGGDLPVFD